MTDYYDIIKESFEKLCDEKKIDAIISILISENNRKILIDKSNDNFFSDTLCKNGIEFAKQILLDKRISDKGLDLLILKEIFKFVNKEENIHFFDELINDEKIEKLILDNLLNDIDSKTNNMCLFADIAYDNLDNIVLYFLQNEKIKKKLVEEKIEGKKTVSTVSLGFNALIDSAKIKKINLNFNVINAIIKDDDLILKLSNEDIGKIFSMITAAIFGTYDEYKDIFFNMLNKAELINKIDKDNFSTIISELSRIVSNLNYIDKTGERKSNSDFIKNPNIVKEVIEKLFDNDIKINKILNGMGGSLSDLIINCCKGNREDLIDIIINNSYIKSNDRNNIISEVLSKAYNQNLEEAMINNFKNKYIKIDNKAEIYSKVLEKACLLDHKETVKKITENTEIMGIIIEYIDNNPDKNIINKCFDNASKVRNENSSSIILRLLLGNKEIESRISKDTMEKSIDTTFELKLTDIFERLIEIKDKKTEQYLITEEKLKSLSDEILNKKNFQNIDDINLSLVIFKQLGKRNIKIYINKDNYKEIAKKIDNFRKENLEQSKNKRDSKVKFSAKKPDENLLNLISLFNEAKVEFDNKLKKGEERKKIELQSLQ